MDNIPAYFTRKKFWYLRNTHNRAMYLRLILKLHWLQLNEMLNVKFKEKNSFQ